MYSQNHTTTLLVRAPPRDAFGFLDDHTRLVAHMRRRSLAMGGGSMAIEFDDGEGKIVGSKMRLRGTAFGVRLNVEEAIIEHAPPYRKSWETVSAPQLLVIGPYRMGFSIEDLGQSCRVTVFIDYELPGRAPWRWLGKLFGRAYARWCTERMAGDAARHFASPRSAV
jgi:hypothetical protein